MLIYKCGQIGFIEIGYKCVQCLDEVLVYVGDYVIYGVGYFWVMWDDCLFDVYFCQYCISMKCVIVVKWYKGELFWIVVVFDID